VCIHIYSKEGEGEGEGKGKGKEHEQHPRVLHMILQAVQVTRQGLCASLDGQEYKQKEQVHKEEALQ